MRRGEEIFEIKVRDVENLVIGFRKLRLRKKSSDFWKIFWNQNLKRYDWKLILKKMWLKRYVWKDMIENQFRKRKFLKLKLITWLTRN